MRNKAPLLILVVTLLLAGLVIYANVANKRTPAPATEGSKTAATPLTPMKGFAVIAPRKNTHMKKFSVITPFGNRHIPPVIRPPKLMNNSFVGLDTRIPDSQITTFPMIEGR